MILIKAPKRNVYSLVAVSAHGFSLRLFRYKSGERRDIHVYFNSSGEDIWYPRQIARFLRIADTCQDWTRNCNTPELIDSEIVNVFTI